MTEILIYCPECKSIAQSLAEKHPDAGFGPNEFICTNPDCPGISWDPVRREKLASSPLQVRFQFEVPIQ